MGYCFEQPAEVLFARLDSISFYTVTICYTIQDLEFRASHALRNNRRFVSKLGELVAFDCRSCLCGKLHVRLIYPLVACGGVGGIKQTTCHLQSCPVARVTNHLFFCFVANNYTWRNTACTYRRDV